jgi:hypothetical protein
MPRLLAVGVTGTLVAASLCVAPAPAAARLGADPAAARLGAGPAAARLGAGPAATAVQPGVMSLTSRDGSPAAQRTVALERPMVASHAVRPAAASGRPRPHTTR